MLFFLQRNLRPKGGKVIPPMNGVIPAKANGNGLNVSSNRMSSASSNSYVGISSSGGTVSNGLSKVHPKPHIKFENLKHAGSQVGRSGAVENGNGIYKHLITMR